MHVVFQATHVSLTSYLLVWTSLDWLESGSLPLPTPTCESAVLIWAFEPNNVICRFLMGQLGSPVCRPLENAGRLDHILAQRKSLSLEFSSTQVTAAAEASYVKCFSLMECILTRSGAMTLPHCTSEADEPQGLLDCILISGQTNMMAQSNGGHGPRLLQRRNIYSQRRREHAVYKRLRGSATPQHQNTRTLTCMF